MGHKLKHILFVAVCLSILGAVVLGQSGRKQKKADPQPPVQGVNQPEARVQPEPEIKPEKPKDKEPRRSIMVASSMPDMMLPLYYADIARQGCISEFREELRSIDIREARNQNRSDASKTAKNEDNTYVVLIELELDRLGSTSSGVDVRYTIFEPKTGKVAGSGSGYPSQPMGRTPVPPIGASRDQIYVEWMGRDVARQVMKRLRLVP
jgi:hypothetical protein